MCCLPLCFNAAKNAAVLLIVLFSDNFAIKIVKTLTLYYRTKTEKCQQLKQKTPQTYVMVCTGERFDADEMKILNNADDLLSKTAGYTEIKDKLEKTIKINFFYKDELNKIFAKMQSKIPSKKQKTVFSLIEATCVSEISSDELRANLESLRITASCIRDILKSIEFLYLG